MPLLAVLLTVATVAARDPLAPALEAFARGDHARAEALALDAAHPPHRGAALYVVGLARFRSGRPAEALAALDAAGRAADPPPRGLWQYNRAACLEALGRLADAGAAFEEAAALDPSLTALALVNAAHLALDAGDRAGARGLATRARAAASGGALDLVADLEDDLDAPDAGPVAAGAAHAAEPGEAPRGLAARGAGWDASVRAGAGYDSNVLQTGLESAREVAPAPGEGTASVTATAGVAVARRWLSGDALAVELSYAADQVAYASTTARDYSLQQHAAALAVEASPGERWRAGAAARGALAFTGLDAATSASPSRRGYRLLQRAAGVGGWLARDGERHATTRLDLEWTRKDTSASEFWYLNGDRLDVALSQELRAGPVEVALVYRYRLEAIGTVTQALAPSAQYRVPLMCGMEGCSQRLVIPFGHTSHAGGLALRVPFGARFAAGGSGGVEWLRYRGASYLAVTGPVAAEQDLGRRVREDIRCSGGAWASLRAWRHLDLTLRWDAVMNVSNIARSGSCGPGVPCPHQYDYDDRNYSKHVVGLEGAWRW